MKFPYIDFIMIWKEIFLQNIKHFHFFGNHFLVNGCLAYNRQFIILHYIKTNLIQNFYLTPASSYY